VAERLVSPPIEVPRRPDGRDYDHADLELHGIDHSGLSFEGRVFLNNRRANESTPRDAASGYVGSFHIFGHGGCFGDVGHCDVPTGPQDAFDYRLPHPLTPATRSIEVTDALKALRDTTDSDTVTVTIVAIPYAPSPRLGRDAELKLQLESISLSTYETSLTSRPS
jgi:tyrosinase